MHPSGVQYGLSRGLLQLNGEEVLLSDAVLETLSLEAQVRVHLRKPPIDGNFLVDLTVRAVEKAMETQTQGKRQEIVPFFAHLNRTMYYTLCRVAERAGLAHREPNRLKTNPEFWDEFSANVIDVKIKKGQSLVRIQKSLFKVCHEIVKRRYAESDPANVRHADLVSLFMFNFWNASGVLLMAQALVIGINAPNEE
jgi:hypothetical protein